MKKYLLALSLISGFIFNGLSQCGDPNWVCMQNGNVLVGDGWTVSDDGGGAPYSDTEYTVTLCPNVPGDVVSLVFSAFALQTSPNGNNSDYLSIFDGDSTGANSLGDYTGSAIQGLSVTGTVSNTSGCLTLVFNPNGQANATSPGFEAQITTTTPCDPPTANSAITNPTPQNAAVPSVSVCLDIPVSFSSAGSAAAPGFTLANYIWNFDDGTTTINNGAAITHSFSEPGEYVVTLTVEDNNGCQSLNIVPLQVLVSTYPIFSGMDDLETCLGQEILGIAVVGSDENINEENAIGGGVTGETWTALPPQVVAGQTYLADGAGFSYSTSLTFDFFETGATLDDCDDLLSIFVNMEHSYMGDLGVFITCPNGTSVDLVTWGTNGGGGTFLGEAIDDGGTDPGIGYDYFWPPDATNGTWGANAGTGSLPAGSYQAAGDLCNLVGCPLNGDWTFSVTDNLAIDNGYIFSWGVNFNPLLFPGVTTFTPTIGAGADSSYWVTTGAQWITDITPDGDIITINALESGQFDYTYVVINSFGCTFDTTITLNVLEAPTVSAGLDLVYSCGELVLDGGLIGAPDVDCATCGDFTYCYDMGGNLFQTYCPDNPGDEAISITFDAGFTEEFSDFLSIYDGENSWTAPFIGQYSGDLTGLTWTSTSPSGCLTMQFWDDWGGGDCSDGVASEWQYTVSAMSAVEATFVWEWTPIENLSNANVANPTVTTLTQSTTFTLVGYPAGHPGCGSTDEVVIAINPLGDPGLDTDILVCFGDDPFSMTDELDGNPVTTGSWTSPTGAALATDSFDPLTMVAGVYTHTVSFAGCNATAELDINMASPTTIDIPNDTSVCFGTYMNLDLYDLNFGLAPFNYNWSYNGTTISGNTSLDYIPANDGVACLTVTDACDYVVQECFDVVVEPFIEPTFAVIDGDLCWPEAFMVYSTVDEDLYTSINWEFGDETTALNQDSLSHFYAEPGFYDVTLSITTNTGCVYSATADNFITSYPMPNAAFLANPQPTDANDTQIFFDENCSGDIVDYQWTFGIPTIGSSSNANPVFTFPLGVGGIYPVNLLVTDVHGCTDDITGFVDINDIFQIYVPNSFTPNNDGVNDVFLISGADIDPNDFEFEVFNRWGESVFASTDPNQAWTGEFQGGEFYAPNGTYNWIARIGSLSTGQVSELTGYIHLFR